eukprot:gene8747-222_t
MALMLYVTSVKAVRATAEQCRRTKSVLGNYKVNFTEVDISLPENEDELAMLQEAAGEEAKVQLPQACLIMPQYLQCPPTCTYAIGPPAAAWCLFGSYSVLYWTSVQLWIASVGDDEEKPEFIGAACTASAHGAIYGHRGPLSLGALRPTAAGPGEIEDMMEDNTLLDKLKAVGYEG